MSLIYLILCFIFVYVTLRREHTSPASSTYEPRAARRADPVTAWRVDFERPLPARVVAPIDHLAAYRPKVL